MAFLNFGGTAGSIAVPFPKAGKWREMIDTAYAEKKEVVIERYGKPIVTVVNHAKWKAKMLRLEELEMLLLHKQRMAEMEADPNLAVTMDEVLQELAAAGLSA